MWVKIPSTAKICCFLQNPAHLSVLSELHKDFQRLGLISELSTKCKCSESSLGRTGLCLSHLTDRQMCIYRCTAPAHQGGRGKLSSSNGKVFRALPSPSLFIHLKLRKSNPTLAYVTEVSPNTQTNPTKWKLLCCSTVPLHLNPITHCDCSQNSFPAAFSSLEPSSEHRELCSWQAQPWLWLSASPSSSFVAWHKHQLLPSCCSALTKVVLKTSVMVCRENNSPPPTE